MFTISNFKYDCTKKCKNPLHGDAITAALTKSSIPDDKLAAFIAKTCKNFAKIRDSSGRSPLYVACCVGRHAIAEWLLNRGALNKYLESSLAPPPCSYFYGSIESIVLLKRYGVFLKETDDYHKKRVQAILQKKCRKRFAIPDLPAEEYTFQNLLNEASEFDIVHDITFHVDNTVFPAHKFIVFSRSNGLMKIASHYKDKNVYLNFTGLTAKMFKLILKFIYSNSLISIEDLDDMLESSAERVDVLNTFKEFVTMFELHDLINFLETFDEKMQFFGETKLNFSPLRRTMFPDLYDVVINCENNQEIYAHKCVLVARVEYFNLMFNSNWAETNVIDLTMIPAEYMEPIVDFLYTLDVDHFGMQRYSENFLYNMIVICDQFFINQLQRLCEALLLKKMPIQKNRELLEFVCSYNCDLLEKGCLEVICYHLFTTLDQHDLESFQPEVLARINSFYRDILQEVGYLPVLLPQSDCISDEKLIEFVSDFTVDLDYRMKIVTKRNSEVRSQKYERAVIRSLKQILLTDEQNPSTSTDKKDKTQTEIKELCGKTHSKSDNWMKVSKNKKVQKRVISTLKTNQIIEEEKNPKGKFNWFQRKRSLKPIEAEHLDEEYEVAPAEQTVSLIDFIKLEKLSEKLRKRLTLESANAKIRVLNSPRKPKYISQSTQEQNDMSSDLQSSLYSFSEILKSPESSKDSNLKPSSGVRFCEESQTSASNYGPYNSAAPVASISYAEALSFSEILQTKESKTSASKKSKPKPKRRQESRLSYHAFMAQ